MFREKLNNEATHFCTGCGACVQKCNKGALTLSQDDQGYFVARFQKDLCVDCNLCEGVCPIIYPKFFEDRAEEPTLYAAQMDDELRKISSSGGVFSAFAKCIIEEGGIVYGAAWTDGFSVGHVGIERVEDLDKLRRSKYVQSFIGNCYREVKKYLKQGRKVLFTGTPCQIAGLNAFLGKDDPNLFTIDVLCMFAPSQGYFKKYIEENYPKNNVTSINMRDKSNGWSGSVHSVTFSFIDGTSVSQWDRNDNWEKGFLEHIMQSEHCEKCKFWIHKRQSDITIGDYWDINLYTLNYDSKGTSAILVNSAKGRWLVDKIAPTTKVIEKRELKEMTGNKLEMRDYMRPHPHSARFRKLFLTKGFNNAVDYALNYKYDIAVLGCYDTRNYGSHLTYYALYKVLRDMGNEVVMIGSPKNADHKTLGYPVYFKDMPYQSWDIQPQYESKAKMREANTLASTFILGSDQLWNPSLYKFFGEFTYLDFIFENKKKIAYGTSFGNSYWKGDEASRAKVAFYLNRFNSISVRETSGIDVCRDVFGVDAQWVLDPVFLMDKKDYDGLISKSDIETNDDYIAAYILDCNERKAEILRDIAKINNCKLQIIADPNYESYYSEGISIRGYKVEDWLKWIKNCKYFITDSFHGMCVGLIFNKQLIAVTNSERGAARFIDYKKKLNIESRVFDSYGDILNYDFSKSNINYDEINKTIKQYAELSKEWLVSALAKENKETNVSLFDIMSIRQDDGMKSVRFDFIEKKVLRYLKSKIRHTKLFKLLWKVYRFVK